MEVAEAAVQTTAGRSQEGVVRMVVKVLTARGHFGQPYESSSAGLNLAARLPLAVFNTSGRPPIAPAAHRPVFFFCFSSAHHPILEPPAKRCTPILS